MRLRGCVVLGLVGSLVAGNAFVPAITYAADAPQKTSREILNKSRDLDKIKEELNRKKEEMDRLQKETERISVELKQGIERIKNVENVLVHSRQQSREIEQNMARVKNRRDRLVSDLEIAGDDLKGSFETYYVASALYGGAAVTPTFSRHLTHTKADRIRNLFQKSEDANAMFQDLSTTHSSVRREVEKQEGALQSIKSNLSDKEVLLEKKKTRQQILESELAELKRTAEEMASLIDVLRSRAKQEAESEKKERLQKQISGHSPIARQSLPWPVKGKITRRFGRQKHPELGTLFVSNGILIQPALKTLVNAVGDGTVLYAGDFMSYGLMVLVEHPGDWYSVYGHLGRWNVEKGQLVKQGEPLGETGLTAEGAFETYFELRFYGKPADPMPWLAP